MRRLFALALSALLVFGFAPVAKADVAGLTPCSESARFQQRASAATTPQAKARFEMYSQAVCGEDGLLTSSSTAVGTMPVILFFLA